MVNKYIIGLCFSLISAHLFAIENAPIQRIDVVNLLSNGGSVITQTPVVITFTSGGASSCFSTTLAYQGAITVLAGAGQPCVTAITNIIITPIANPLGFALAYDDQSAPSSDINTSFYSTQMLVNQKTPPVFDPGNGALLVPGSVQAIINNHIKHTSSGYRG